ncbi:MAG TPA: GNAT family protein [Gammaproteobacteria bacterium]|nr:GNAT family protein [Gammaproteobacteria bacterium]
MRLIPVDPESDVDDLFSGAHGNADVEALWTYMPYGPFGDRGAMRTWLQNCAGSTDPLFFTVHDLRSGRRAGMVSFLNFVSAMRTIELGHIWYQPRAQRSKINTESVYLMLCEAFDAQRSRRVEWKCDALNARSRAAALRLGFSFEGIFRQHLIVKGRNRDTAWFSMLDREWPQVRANMETWLYGRGARSSLRSLNAGIVSNKTPI